MDPRHQRIHTPSATLGMMLSLAPLLLQACPAPHLTSKGGDEPWEAPDNSWFVGDVPEDLVGEGFGVGEVALDFRVPDQFGAQVSLWQFFGQVVLVDISTLWCAPCQDLAEDAEETWQDFRGEGFVYVTLLPEDLEYEVPSQEDLMLWVDSFELTAPVLADDVGWAEPLVPSGGFPRLILIGRDMRVLDPEIYPISDARIRELVEANL